MRFKELRPGCMPRNVLVGALALVLSQACRAQSDDAALKAAYIYNFAQFTIWPPAPPAQPFAVCASPAHPLWDSLRRLEGKPVNGRHWAVVEAATGKPCDVSVLLSGTRPPAKEAVGTLYIVDGPRGGYAGAIALVEEDQRLRFDVNTGEAGRAGLRFSAKLLRMARNVF